MTDAPVDLDELEARMCGTLTYAELRGFVAALISEVRAARAGTPADHEPFAPMECCGRDRDKDGGPNPHCECPALARVEAERVELKRDMAKVIVAENERVCAVIEAARSYVTALRYGNGYGPLERMRAALSALDQAASEAEVTT